MSDEAPPPPELFDPFSAAEIAAQSVLEQATPLPTSVFLGHFEIFEKSPWVI